MTAAAATECGLRVGFFAAQNPRWLVPAEFRRALKATGASLASERLRRAYRKGYWIGRKQGEARLGR